MSETIRVPDIGSGEGEVIELFVKVGDRIEADQSILTLESDKASMEIPAPKAGVVKSLKDRLHDRFQVAVAETDHLDLWQRAELTACAVSAQRRQTEKVLQSLDDFVAGDARVRIIGAYRTYF